MSDDVSKSEQASESNALSPDEVLSWLQLSAPEYRCEICGNGDFGVRVDDERNQFESVLLRLAERPNRAIKYILIECSNCGNTKLLAYHRLAATIRNAEDEADGT